MFYKICKLSTLSHLFLSIQYICNYYTRKSAFRKFNPKFRFLEKCMYSNTGKTAFIGIKNITPIFPAVRFIIKFNFAYLVSSNFFGNE